MFKECFKYYKSRKPPPSLKNVVDFETSTCFSSVKVLILLKQIK